jgi:hypothetical protein
MDSVGLALEPLFASDGERWLPRAETGGPFGGLHGGAVSGLIVGEMERAARAHGLGAMLSASVMLLRPAPMAPLTTRTTLLRKGARTGALETELLADGKLIAKATASCVAPLPVADTPAAAPRPSDPAALPAWPIKPRFAHATLFDALDIRVAADGVKWGRLTRPLLAHPTALAQVFAVADNGQPFSLFDHRRQLPRYGFPNIDITVHVARPPAGEWLGVEARSDWRPEGMGLTESALFDAQGILGRACQTIVLMPFS